MVIYAYDDLIYDDDMLIFGNDTKFEGPRVPGCYKWQGREMLE